MKRPPIRSRRQKRGCVMGTQRSVAKYFNSTESNPCVIALGLNRSCWHCEQSLRCKPLAVVATVGQDDCRAGLVHLVCSDDCLQRFVCLPTSIFNGSSSLRSARPSSLYAPSRTCYSNDVTRIRWTRVRACSRIKPWILSSVESATAYPDPLRKVSYFDPERNKRLKFLTF